MRNAIMDAFMARLQLKLGTSVKKYSRRFQILTQIPASAQMPCLMLTRPEEDYPKRESTRLPPKRTLMTEVFIYFSDGQDQAAEPDRALCDIQDKVDLVFKPDPGQEKITLGGLVDHCYIEGKIKCVPGDLDGLGMLSIPVIIVIP